VIMEEKADVSGNEGEDEGEANYSDELESECQEEGKEEGKEEGIPSLNDILSKIDDEESRLEQERCLNEDLVPKEKRRGVCTITVDKEFKKFLRGHKYTSDGGTFWEYIKDRRSENCLEPIVNQCCQFVTYLKMKNESYLQVGGSEVIEAVTRNQPSLFHEYLNHLLRGGSLKPGTIHNRIDSIQYLIEWLRYNCNNEIYFKYSHIIERLKEERNRFHSINRKHHRENSIDQLVKKRLWVDDGVEGLQAMMLDSWPYFDALVSLSCYIPLSKTRYSWALSYTLASMWCLTVNARVKSIESLTMKAFKELQVKKFHLSKSFKTSSIYHYQVKQNEFSDLTHRYSSRLSTQPMWRIYT